MQLKLPFVFIIISIVALSHDLKANPLSRPEINSPELANIYRQNCSHCHSGSAPSAPTVGDTQAWTSRLSRGFNQLYSSAIQGVPNTAMIAKGGHQDLSDDQIKLLVGYMLSASKVSAKTVNEAIKYDSYNITDVFTKAFSQFDKNKDGSLSPTEFIELRSTLENRRQSIKISDEEITQQITLNLSNIQGMPPSGIRVNTKNGHVMIAGVVGSNEIVNKIWQSIRWMPGIKTFDNRLMTAEMLAFD